MIREYVYISPYAVILVDYRYTQEILEGSLSVYHTYCTEISNYDMYVYILEDMFVKVNKVTIKNAEVTQLDIDDYGSVIPLRDLELMIPSNDDSIFHALNGTPYAIIFTDRQEINESEGKRGLATIILANPITMEELNEEKRKIIESINKK